MSSERLERWIGAALIIAAVMATALAWSGVSLKDDIERAAAMNLTSRSAGRYPGATSGRPVTASLLSRMTL